mmetsp:Transcript_101809/g.288199  ORF Transcript_101809/g.288199 Transcript_101809/m.288199 type:complete len:261 (-) Transcript_101809:315-1097(-)
MPISGRASRFASSFLALSRLCELPTSSGWSAPSVACSSRAAQGSSSIAAETSVFLSVPTTASSAAAFFSAGVFTSSFFDGVCLSSSSLSFSFSFSSSSTSRDFALSSSGIPFSSSCSRLSRSWTSLGGAGTSGPSWVTPCMESSVASRSSSSRESDSWSRYTPVGCTVQELMRNSFLCLSFWSRGMRKSGTRLWTAWRCSGAERSRTMLRPSLIRWSIVSSSSVSGIGAQRPLCPPLAFLPGPSLPFSRDSRSNAWYTSW